MISHCLKVSVYQHENTDFPTESSLRCGGPADRFVHQNVGMEPSGMSQMTDARES